MRRPRSSASPTASRPNSSRTPGSRSTACSSPGRSPYRNSRVGRVDVSPKDCRWAANSRAGPGKSRWFNVERGSVRSPSRVRLGQVLGAVRLAGRPARALVRNGSGHPPGGSPSCPRRNPTTDSGTSKRPGSASNAAGSTPARRGAARGHRPPWRMGSPSPAGRGCGPRRRRSTRWPRSGRRGRARWPAAAGSTAGRRESRGGRPVRSATAARTRRGRTASVPLPSTARGRRRPAGRARSRGRCGRWRRRSRRARAATSCPTVGAGPVDGVGAGGDRREIGGELPAGGVVGVHVDRQVELPAQRGDQSGGGRWS